MCVCVRDKKKARTLTYYNAVLPVSGIPNPDEITSNPPWIPDSKRRIEEPFLLKDWLDKNMSNIQSTGSVKLFRDIYQTDVFVMGKGPDSSRKIVSKGAETFLWQLRGASRVNWNGKEHVLKEDDNLLIPQGHEFTFSSEEGAATLSILMDPNNKSRLKSE